MNRTNCNGMTRRAMLRGLAISGLSLSLSGAAQAQVAAASVSVLDFRQPGDPDDSAAFRRALATGRPVHVPAGEGRGPGGVYLVDQVDLADGATLFGDGATRTVIHALPRTDVGPAGIIQATAGSEPTAVSNLTLRDLQLRDDVVRRGFLEHRHLVLFRGVRNVVLENVHLVGFRGDGICLAGTIGHPHDRSDYRHNSRVVLRDCVFDGVNNDNRNGVSITDGREVSIERCVFRNCTRPSMPGAIDIEPDPYPHFVVGNIRVSDCQFENVGGNSGVIALFVPPQVLAQPAGFAFLGNRMNAYRGSGSDYLIDIAGRNAARSAAVVIAGHRGTGGERPYQVLSGRDIRIASDCEWRDYRSAALAGYVAAHQVAYDLVDEGSYWRVGYAGPPSQFGVAIFNVQGGRWSGTYVDCGDGSADASALLFAPGQSREIELRGLTVTSPRGRTRQAVLVNGHRFDAGTTRSAANDFGGLPAAQFAAGR